MRKTGLKIPTLLTLVLVVTLAACQAPPSTTQPIPFTGSHRSVLGASALALRQKPENTGVLLVPISAATGKPTPGYAPIDVGYEPRYGFSPSREQIAFLSGRASNCSETCLHLLDLRTWKENIQPIPLSVQVDGWITGFSFDSQGQRIAFAANDQINPASRVTLVDLRQGKVTAQANLPFNVYHLGFTPDNNLALHGVVTPAGRDPVAHVTLLDGSNLKVLWEQDLGQVHYGFDTPASLSDPSAGRYLDPAVVFSLDHSRLYIVPADESSLVSVDFTHRTVQRTVVAPPKSWLDRLVESLVSLASQANVAYAKTLNGTYKDGMLSGDGKILYVTGQTSTAVKDKDGNWTANYTPLGLQAIDVATGTEVATLKTEATSLLISPDGKDLFLTGWGQDAPWTEVVAAKDLKLIAHLEGQIRPTRLLDGSLAWLYATTSPNGNSKLGIYVPDGSASTVQWKVLDPGFIDWVAAP